MPRVLTHLHINYRSVIQMFNPRKTLNCDFLSCTDHAKIKTLDSDTTDTLKAILYSNSLLYNRLLLPSGNDDAFTDADQKINALINILHMQFIAMLQKNTQIPTHSEATLALPIAHERPFNPPHGTIIINANHNFRIETFSGSWHLADGTSV
jgi:hypothetical protein